QATAERAEHLVRGLARGGDQEHVPEPLLVRAVLLRQRGERRLRRAVRSDLLAPRPVRRGLSPIADPRVSGECLQPVGAPQLPPDPLRRREQLGVARERARGEHRVHPVSRAAATTEGDARGGDGERVQIRSRGGRHADLPHTRSRATPPSGKMFSRTWVTGSRFPGGTARRWRALARSVVRATSSCQGAPSGGAPLPGTSHPSRLALSGKLPLKWVVSRSTRSITPRRPRRSTTQS